MCGVQEELRESFRMLDRDGTGKVRPLYPVWSGTPPGPRPPACKDDGPKTPSLSPLHQDL